MSGESEHSPPSGYEVYQAALRHARFMGIALIVSILFVLIVERMAGHSSAAFGIAIVGLVIANARMLSFNCPHCGKNLFFRGIFVVPWPNAVCGRCGSDLQDPRSE